MTLCHLFLAKMFIYLLFTLQTKADYLHHTSSMSTEEVRLCRLDKVPSFVLVYVCGPFFLPSRCA